VVHKELLSGFIIERTQLAKFKSILGFRIGFRKRENSILINGLQSFALQIETETMRRSQLLLPNHRHEVRVAFHLGHVMQGTAHVTRGREPVIQECFEWLHGGASLLESLQQKFPVTKLRKYAFDGYAR